MTPHPAPPRPVPDPCRAVEDFHPLEVVPFFRRWRPGLARDLLYTFIWSCGLGLMFWILAAVFGPKSIGAGDLVANLLVANCVGYTIHALFTAGGHLGLARWVHGRGLLFRAFAHLFKQM